LNSNLGDSDCSQKNHCSRWKNAFFIFQPLWWRINYIWSHQWFKDAGLVLLGPQYANFLLNPSPIQTCPRYTCRSLASRASSSPSCSIYPSFLATNTSGTISGPWPP
jgi:hypothetical protein